MSARLQIWAAIVKLILYSCFVPCFSSTVWFIIVSVMLYASSLAHESNCLIHKAYVTFCVDARQNFFRMAPDQEILSLFHNMCHVVISAIAAVTDIDIFSSIQNIMPVNNITESTEFIFAADGLDQRIRVSMGIQVIKSIQMHVVDTVGRVFRATVVVW